MSISDQAKLMASNFIHVFNALDQQAFAKTLNYPHIRLTKGEFQTIAHHEKFAVLSEHAENSLRNEGWDPLWLDTWNLSVWAKTRFTCPSRVIK